MIAVLGSRHRVPFGEADHDCLQSLVPHLRRAVELRAHLDEKDASRSVAQDVIEGMLTGVVLLDEHGRVLMANAAARRIARAEDGLAFAGERLRASSPPTTARLRGRVGRIEATSPGERGTSVPRAARE